MPPVVEPTNSSPRILVAKIGKLGVSETFIEDQVRRLPGVVAFHDRNPPPSSRLLASVTRRTGWQGILGGGRYWDRVIAEAKPDVVLAEFGETGVAMLSAARRANVPLVVHFHGSDAWVSAHSHRHSYKVLFRHAAAVVAASEAMATRLVELGASRPRVRVVPIGVDTDVFLPGDPSSAPIHFVGVGRFMEVKRHDYAVRAFAKVHKVFPEARLTIVGDGSPRSDCLRLVEELGLNGAVSLPGAQPRSEIPPLLGNARAFVHHAVTSDAGAREGLGVAVAEAHAAGLPVVATRSGGIPEIVADGVSGYLVAERDVDGMAAAMLRLASDPQAALELGRAGRKRVVREQSLDRAIRQLFDVISSAHRNRKAGQG
jgi:colanic acid/amylovoran biosynthesis glycosyltransferase